MVPEEVRWASSSAAAEAQYCCTTSIPCPGCSHYSDAMVAPADGAALKYLLMIFSNKQRWPTTMSNLGISSGVMNRNASILYYRTPPVVKLGHIIVEQDAHEQQLHISTVILCCGHHQRIAPHGGANHGTMISEPMAIHAPHAIVKLKHQPRPALPPGLLKCSLPLLLPHVLRLAFGNPLLPPL